MPNDIKFAPHFPLAELTHSDTANAYGIDNSAPPELLQALSELSWKAEQARSIIGCALHINSGYRSPKLNKIIARGASSTGAHPLGRAIDVLPLGISIDNAYRMLIDHPTFMLDVDQLIKERGCIHIGLLIKNGPHESPRHELRHDEWVNGVRRYPLDGVWGAENA